MKFLVWRLCDGYGNASTFEAFDHDDAACKAHGNDFEYDDTETFCVQIRAPKRHGFDRKVRVVTVQREYVPEFSARAHAKSALLARCACGARLFQNRSIDRQCRRCWVAEHVQLAAARAAEVEP